MIFVFLFNFSLASVLHADGCIATATRTLHSLGVVSNLFLQVGIFSGDCVCLHDLLVGKINFICGIIDLISRGVEHGGLDESDGFFQVGFNFFFWLHRI